MTNLDDSVKYLPADVMQKNRSLIIIHWTKAIQEKLGSDLMEILGESYLVSVQK